MGRITFSKKLLVLSFLICPVFLPSLVYAQDCPVSTCDCIPVGGQFVGPACDANGKPDPAYCSANCGYNCLNGEPPSQRFCTVCLRCYTNHCHGTSQYKVTSNLTAGTYCTYEIVAKNHNTLGAVSPMISIKTVNLTCGGTIPFAGGGSASLGFQGCDAKSAYFTCREKNPGGGQSYITFQLTSQGGGGLDSSLLMYRRCCQPDPGGVINLASAYLCSPPAAVSTVLVP